MYFGAGNAEAEPELENYFLQTGEYNDLLTGRYTLVRGTKGCGKSAISSILSKSKTGNIIKIPLSAISGAVQYEKLFEDNPSEELTIDHFRKKWKDYIALRIAQFLLVNPIEAEASVEYDNLKQVIFGIIPRPVVIDGGNISEEEWVNRLLSEIEEIVNKRSIDSDSTYSLIQKLLTKWDKQVWVILDRLDETILSSSDRQQNAIDALLVVMKDLSKYVNIKLIAFLREDLYKKIMYPHLDHFRSMTRNIQWDRDKLVTLIAKRISNARGEEVRDLTPKEAEDIFFTVFENKIPNSNARNCFDWMYNHLMDGNGLIVNLLNI